MKAAHIEFPPRTRQATWREWYEAVVIGEQTVVIWRHDGDRNSHMVATLEGREALEQLAHKILRRVGHKKRRGYRHPLQLLRGAKR